jgi:sortase A
LKVIRGAERVAWLLGIALIAVYGAVRVHGAVLTQQDLARFERARLAASGAVVAGESTGVKLRLPANVDTSLWSAGRIEKYEHSLEQETPPPLAVLRIPKIRLEVPVLEGTDDHTLNRAVGRIESTARPGEPGNIGIAGHRDGYFRGLKDIARGDTIELATLHGTDSYVVDWIRIVDPDDVDVLGPTAEPTLTLVTCYPFYYVGSAPRRYIVHAVRLDTGRDPETTNGS